jgi:hypothetical protein
LEPKKANKWTADRKKEYAKERYYRLKGGRSIAKESSKRVGQKKARNSKRQLFQPYQTRIRDLTRELLPDSTKIEITGNPFVDTGLAVIAVRRGLNTIDNLTLGDLRSIHADGMWLARESEPLKCFTMIFTTNSLLRNPSIKDRNRRIKMQAAITTELLNSIGEETEEEYCEACGNERTVELASLTSRALSSLGEEQQDRFIGRDWFPLAGSLGSDAQALPSASKDPSLCARCLFAVQYLPLGVRLFGRELVVFQSTSYKFWYELVQDIARQIQSRIDGGSNEILGSKQGRAGLAIQLLDHFKQLREAKKHSNLEEHTKLYAWRFANSTAPNLEIDEIPNHALIFLYIAAAKYGLSKEIIDLMKRERIPEDRTFFASITARRDYYGLYPGKVGKEKGYQGASQELFLLYQTQILGREIQSLKAAYEVARLGLEQQEKEWNAALLTTGSKTMRKQESERSKEIERLTRSEAFRELRTRSRYRKIMAELARSGKFSLRAYLNIFPYLGDDSVSVSYEGWNLIRYYTGMTARKTELDFIDEEASPRVARISPNGSQIMQLVRDSAQAIFRNYVKERGLERFESDVLGRLERGKLGVNWLRIQFIKLARQEIGFNYVSWAKQCHPQERQWTFTELLFQYRLLWSEWLSQSSAGESQEVIVAPTKETLQGLMESSGIPLNIAESLLYQLNQYATERGWERVERDLLLRFQRGELGFGWFVSKLIRDSLSAVNEKEFEEFLHDSEGKLQIAERTFEMILFLSNAYRIIRDSPAVESLVLRVS